MYKVIPVLTSAELAALVDIAAAAPFVDGRISNPHNIAKKNEQLHEPEAYQRSAQILHAALLRSEEFRNFAVPAVVAAPMLTRYQPGMHYGLHTDTAFLPISAQQTIRSDLSCTIFLSDSASYEGGALHIRLNDADLRFKLKPGEAIVYPSDTLHEVEPVTSGERLVAISFIQSRIADPFKRTLLYNLGEVAALEGLKMQRANFTMLQLIQNQLLRHWGEAP